MRVSRADDTLKFPFFFNQKLLCFVLFSKIVKIQLFIAIFRFSMKNPLILATTSVIWENIVNFKLVCTTIAASVSWATQFEFHTPPCRRFKEHLAWHECEFLYSDCLRQESNVLASTRRHCLVCACLLHCMRVRLRNGYTQAYAQIMQHTHTHKTVTGCVEAKKLLSHRRQSNYSR